MAALAIRAHRAERPATAQSGGQHQCVASTTLYVTPDREEAMVLFDESVESLSVSPGVDTSHTWVVRG